MFIVTITYTQPIEAIEARTVEHREWLDQHVASGLIVAAGPMVPRTGGILVVASRISKDELATLLKDDPFMVHDLADYKITEFKAGKLNPAMVPFA
ncbi:YCII-related domain protein [Brevundimonas sp. SH203]|uniref:YciI family protein n=1 Tax=Brevundimonas sp. SH203 TaxID=345167 RepID=UPI0009CB744E|nr:YciI family protein [Brevundimonas sp. SH203]GAW40891.1 YCII-related domain protein [Brevundimonas sp. SH203]